MIASQSLRDTPRRSRIPSCGKIFNRLYAVRLFASKRARAFFPSLSAAAMLSKKTGERSTGSFLPAQ